MVMQQTVDFLSCNCRSGPIPLRYPYDVWVLYRDLTLAKLLHHDNLNPFMLLPELQTRLCVDYSSDFICSDF